MTARTSITGLLAVVCLLLVWATFSEGRQLSGLREEQQRILAHVTNPAPATIQEPTPAADTPGASAGSSSELLRLRNDVSRLTRRKKELVVVQRENERLQVQLASAATNTAAALPSGYIRKADAQNVGFATPEATAQTFLWAVRNKEVKTFLESLTPDAAEAIQREAQRSGRSVARALDAAEAMPGMSILRTEPNGPGQLKATVEFVPDVEASHIIFQQINGQWKMSLPH